MNCRDTVRLLNGYVDAELDPSGVLAVEDHLQACARCRAHHASLRAVQTAVRRHTEFHGAPASLRERLEARYGHGGARHAAKLRSWFIAAPGLAALLLALWIGFGSIDHRGKDPAEARAKVVFQVSQSGSASTALRNLGNHLEASPNATLVVVAHNDGVDFLLRGARDESGQLFEPAVAALKSRGVDFRICGNTLTRRQIDTARIIPAAKLVPSGVAEISRLQSQEGYAYLRL